MKLTRPVHWPIWVLVASHIAVLLALPAASSLPGLYKYTAVHLGFQCAFSVQPVLVGFWFAMSHQRLMVRLLGATSAVVAIPLLYFGPGWAYIKAHLLTWAFHLCVQLALTMALATGSFLLMARQKTLSDETPLTPPNSSAGFSLIQLGWSVAILSTLWAMAKTALYTRISHLVVPLDLLIESIISVCIGAALCASFLRAQGAAGSVAFATFGVFVTLLPIGIYRSIWMSHWLQRIHYEVIDFACGVVAFLCSFLLIRSSGFRLHRRYATTTRQH